MVKQVKINVDFDKTRTEIPATGAPLDQIIGYLMNKVSGSSSGSPQIAPFTISADSWTQLDTPKGGCNYSADFTINGVTTEDTADIIFDIDCFNALSAANVSTGGETGENKVTMYAVSSPASELSGVIIIYKGEV